MRSSIRVAILIALAATACGKGNPAAPSPTPTSASARVITLSGNMAFGSLPIGSTSDAILRITNSGTAPLTVTALTGPTGFTAGWTTGSVAAGGSQDVMVRFSPMAQQSYGGTLTVSADQTSGTNTIAISGTGTMAGGVPLTGVVTDGGTGSGIGGATITVMDGPATGRSATTSTTGAYRFDNLAIGTITLTVRASGYTGTSSNVYVDGINGLSFALQPDLGPLWSFAGVGESSFNIPANVARIRITASYAGTEEVFIVQIGARRVVDEVMGTRWGVTAFDTTFDTAGGMVDIYYSVGVSWSFTEVR